MDSSNLEDIHTMISNDTLMKKLHKEELCRSLQSTKLNVGESSYVFQQIRSEYEIGDRFDIIHHLSFDFSENKNIDITKIFELLRIFGKCIEWDAFDSIIDTIESTFSRNKQQNNKNIEAMKYDLGFNFYKIYDFFDKIADENDVEAMSFAFNKKLHKLENENNMDIFSYSLAKSNINLMRFMIESGIDYTQYLLSMINEPTIIDIKHFLKIPHFDVNAKDDYNYTALIYASENGKHEVVKLLLTFPGIDVNAKDSENRTALIWASVRGHHEVVKLLLTVPGIDVNIKDNENKTALIWASANGRHEIVKLFLTVPGIDVNAKDKDNKTALIRASENGRHVVVKLLLTVPGIDVNAKDEYNNTALYWALANGHHEIVKLLLAVPRI